jgi:hypothetical protein
MMSQEKTLYEVFFGSSVFYEDDEPASEALEKRAARPISNEKVVDLGKAYDAHIEKVFDVRKKTIRHHLDQLKL